MPDLKLYLLPDLLRVLLLVAIESLLVLCAALLIIMIVHKILVERRERRMTLLKSRYLSSLYRSLAGEGSKVARPGRGDEFEALADVCIFLMAEATPAELEILRKIVRDCGIADYYRGQLAKARFWIAKYRAVEKLGFLKLPELAPLFRALVSAEADDGHVVGKAAWALSMICSEEDLPHLLSRMAHPVFMSAKFNEHLFVNVIASFSAAGGKERLLSLFGGILAGNEVPLLVKRDFVEACGNAGLAEAAPLIVSCARGELGAVAEMRIASLRSMEKLGGEILDAMVVAGLGDTDWRVRAVAAKSVEKCSDAVVEPLERVLNDSNYYVRLNAALSLWRKGPAGRAALGRQAGSQDRFARDIARYVMQEPEAPC